MDAQKFETLLSFTLFDALLGRRSRRFFKGAHIPDGFFHYKSKHSIYPLSEEEKLILLLACGSNTSWNHLIYRAQRYAPHLSNYALAAGGRTFPSAAGFHTSKTFFTDDNGVYILDQQTVINDRSEDGTLDFSELLTQIKSQIRKLQNSRLKFPAKAPFTEAHNTWVANHPGSFLIIPVADLAQHTLAALAYYLQNGVVFFDDINKCAIPGIEQYKELANTENPLPITFLEQWSLAEVTAELSMSCFAGSLALQALGLGGWVFDGLDPFTVLGASGAPEAPGLKFNYTTDERWPYPNPTGLAGVMEGFCPPFFPEMRGAVEALCDRKFGNGGPFNPNTPGPWKQSSKVRSSAQIHDEKFRSCVALQAQYVLNTFGKFPGTVPSMFVITYLQAHHLDTDFYDHFYKPGAYLKSHADHMKNWHK